MAIGNGCCLWPLGIAVVVVIIVVMATGNCCCCSIVVAAVVIVVIDLDKARYSYDLISEFLFAQT